MKQLLILVVLTFLSAVCSNVYAQQTPPAVTGDKDLRDTDVKRRSIDMERVEQDAKKGNKKQSGNTASEAEDKLASKFAEIKTDYEQIQLSQDAVLKAYKVGEKIDYAKIGKSAEEINNSAARLNLNLFPAEAGEKKQSKKEGKKQGEDETKPVKSVRDIIVELDNTIGSFVTSPMFQNLRVADTEVLKKARAELEKIIELSALLKTEARRSETTGQ